MGIIDYIPNMVLLSLINSLMLIENTSLYILLEKTHKFANILLEKTHGFTHILPEKTQIIIYNINEME